MLINLSSLALGCIDHCGIFDNFSSGGCLYSWLPQTLLSQGWPRQTVLMSVSVGGLAIFYLQGQIFKELLQAILGTEVIVVTMASPSLTRWSESLPNSAMSLWEWPGAFKPSRDPWNINTTVVRIFSSMWAIFLFIRRLASRVPCLSTYTVLDVEVGAIHDQESDHLVPVQPHGVMQGGISFLEKQSEQTRWAWGQEVGPARVPGWGSYSKYVNEWSFRRPNSAGLLTRSLALSSASQAMICSAHS